MSSIGHLNIREHQFTFVFRHRYEKRDDELKMIRDVMWRKWKIGLWYRFSKSVGKKEFKNPNKWGPNLVGSHMFGIDLLILTAWVDYNKGAMILGIPDHKKI